MLGARCRFQPSCSQYGYEAIEVYGAARGSWMTLRRLVRCRPGVPGGYDPVPPRQSAPLIDPATLSRLRQSEANGE